MKQYIVVIITGTIFLGAVGGFGYVFSNIQKNIAQLERTSQEIQEVSVRDDVAQTMTSFLGNIGSLRTALKKYVVADTGVITSIELVERTARTHHVNLSLSSVTVVEEKEWSSHEGVEISFSASGTFAHMMGFIGAIESLPLASKVLRTSLEASTQGDWFGVFTIFFVKEKI